MSHIGIDEFSPFNSSVSARLPMPLDSLEADQRLAVVAKRWLSSTAQISLSHPLAPHSPVFIVQWICAGSDGWVVLLEPARLTIDPADAPEMPQTIVLFDSVNSCRQLSEKEFAEAKATIENDAQCRRMLSGGDFNAETKNRLVKALDMKL